MNFRITSLTGGEIFFTSDVLITEQSPTTFSYDDDDDANYTNQILDLRF